MAQAHSLLAAQMAEKIEKLTEMLEQLLSCEEEEIGLLRWRMLRTTQQLANDIEGLDNNSVMHQLHEQTQWLIRKAHEQDRHYSNLESSLEGVGKSLETLHFRMKQLDQRLNTLSSARSTAQQPHEPPSKVADKEVLNSPSEKSTPQEEPPTTEKPIFELKFNITPASPAEPLEARTSDKDVQESTIPSAATPLFAAVELPKPTLQEEVESQEEPIEEALTSEIQEVDMPESMEERESEKSSLVEDIPTITIPETPEDLPQPLAINLPAPLKVIDFFDPRTLTLAERQRADNLKTTITLVEKFQLSKAFFGGDDSAMGQALEAMNKMSHLEEAEQHLGVLAAQYGWDVSDPQLLVLVKAVWRKLGVR